MKWEYKVVKQKGASKGIFNTDFDATLLEKSLHEWATQSWEVLSCAPTKLADVSGKLEFCLMLRKPR